MSKNSFFFLLLFLQYDIGTKFTQIWRFGGGGGGCATNLSGDDFLYSILTHQNLGESKSGLNSANKIVQKKKKKNYFSLSQCFTISGWFSGAEGKKNLQSCTGVPEFPASPCPSSPSCRSASSSPLLPPLLLLLLLPLLLMKGCWILTRRSIPISSSSSCKVRTADRSESSSSARASPSSPSSGGLSPPPTPW